MQQDKSLLNAIDTYFDALYYCDPELLDKVFHPQSSLFDVDQGTVFIDPVASFREDVARRPSPASINQARHQEVLLIDWLSDQAVTVKVRVRSLDSIFVDHLCLVKTADKWQIVSKVWHLETRAR
jgi:hypothetical protein